MPTTKYVLLVVREDNTQHEISAWGVDGNDAVRKASLLEKHGDLVAVRRGPVVQVDHDGPIGERTRWAKRVNGFSLARQPGALSRFRLTTVICACH